MFDDILFFMMKLISALSLLFYSCMAIAQDSTKVDVEHAKNLGFYIGASYSLVSIDSKPYFTDSAGKVGFSDVKNKVGLNAGLCYYVKLGKSLLFRPAVEVNMIPAVIQYDTDINHRDESGVFPFTFEVPIGFIYSRNVSGGITAYRRRWPEIGAAVRPVMAIPAFNSVRPKMKKYNLNLDLSLGYPIKLKRTTMRVEVLFSYGLFNLIGEDETDVKTYSVNTVGRSYAGMRLYFN